MSISLRFLLAAALLMPLPARARQSPEPPSELRGVTVGSIRVERLNVFDPRVLGEDWWPFRVANKLHYSTREHVIRREFLFAPGQAWDELKVLESERNLRANGSFRRVEIIPFKHPDGRVDALVQTQDSWTTNPRFSAGTEGGESFFGAGIEEGNILGYGKSATFDYERVGSKISQAYSYGDPRFLGTRLALGGRYSRGTIGDAARAALTRPFYALDSANAFSLSWDRNLTEVPLYRNAAEFSKFVERRRKAETSLGCRLNDDRLFVQRVEAGWFTDRAQFTPTVDTVAGSLPIDRELSGPTLGYSWVQARYIKEDFIDRMERVEDFNLGNEFSIRGGWMGEALNSDRDRTILNASNQQGLRIAPGRFAIARVGLTGRTAGGKVENGLLTANLNVFWKTNWRGDHTLVGHLEGDFGRSLDRESYIVLGGNTGLRGYKNNSFVGGKAVLLNFEDRFFFEGEWFHLARIGAAMFVDAGIVANETAALTLRNLKSDLGVGLRVASTRSRSGRVGRVDLAYALNGGPGGPRWVLTIRGGQAFSLFNSASTRVDSSPASRLN
ncbi:MAG: BamA/TamA family outer membrane protein [Elusimicrobiota bacterium]